MQTEQPQDSFRKSILSTQTLLQNKIAMLQSRYEDMRRVEEVVRDLTINKIDGSKVKLDITEGKLINDVKNHVNTMTVTGLLIHNYLFELDNNKDQENAEELNLLSVDLVAKAANDIARAHALLGAANLT